MNQSFKNTDFSRAVGGGHFDLMKTFGTAFKLASNIKLENIQTFKINHAAFQGE